MRKSLIVGYGEIGQAVEQVIGAQDTVAVYDTVKVTPRLPSTTDLLHVCFPYSDTFVAHVKKYAELCHPKYIIVWATVPIGTTKRLGANAVHSPVEGVHPHLAESIKTMRRWVGANTTMATSFMESYFAGLGLKTTIVPNSDYTEFLKLRSTSKYGINLVWTDYEARVADSLGMDFELVRDFDRDYNALYSAVGKPQYQRYILTPPEGKIGGHCVVPNAKLLDDQYPSDLLKMIKEME